MTGRHRIADALKTLKNYTYVDRHCGMRKAQVSTIRVGEGYLYACTITGPLGNWAHGEGWR